jgi:hypothetical protein|tara:strand:- start:177 stop:347 length:171 start_codon:yes stop_codon:yes gene_type:complete
MSKAELHDVLVEMVEHTSVATIMDEIVAGMSTDELKETVKHIDQHLFGNHFLTRET